MEEDALDELDERLSEMIENDCHTGDTERDISKADSHLCELLRRLGMRHTLRAYQNAGKLND